ncbi:GNAT family N-acetyltransferase [Breznakia sp. PF5-3]|uniref:GNAT family N-acetyltransferase n=1 Tax=Breznakia sp. PF5-3 TaxID=2940649 RepID=UPI0024077149|nr:GNAT family N-acetyltransferase [Breznakia sp. PF5-3]
MIESLLLQKVDELSKKGLVQWEKEEVLWKTLQNEYVVENFYLVYQDDDPVGCFCVIDYDPTYWLHDKPHEALYIHKVMVLDKVKGQGVSNYILDQFKELGRKAGMPCVKLDVRAHKDKLRAYYERNDFILEEIVDLGKGYLTALYRYDLV